MPHWTKWTPVLTQVIAVPVTVNRAAYLSEGLLTFGQFQLMAQGSGGWGQISMFLPVAADEEMIGKPIGTVLVYDVSVGGDYALAFALVPWTQTSATFQQVANGVNQIALAVGDIVGGTFTYSRPPGT